MTRILLCSIAGVMAWSLAEYLMHNFNGHRARGKTLFSREHLKHHADSSYFAPTRLKILGALPAMSAVGAVSVLLLGVAHGGAFTVSFAVTYAVYEVIHRRIHTHPPRGPYGRFVRRHHLAHHYVSPHHNHGVTSPIWDLIFATYTAPGVIRVPERHAMPWLYRPGTDEVDSRWSADYELLRRRVRKETLVASEENEDVTAAYAGIAPNG